MLSRFLLAAAALGGAAWLAAAWPAPRQSACPGGNGGITLPPGFCATVFADTLGIARHLVVAPNGDVFVNIASGSSASRIPRMLPHLARGAVVALRDTNHDGRADLPSRSFVGGGTGITWWNGWLYVARSTEIIRVRQDTSGLGLTGNPDTVVREMPGQPGHASKSIAIDDQGNLFVSVGSATNACRARRTDPAPDPCPEMTERSGIWRFRADRIGQRHAEGERWATGIRNAVALTWSREPRGLFALSHGRDRLSELFPQLYTVEDNAELPAEEFFRVERGDDYGWPYCYYDGRRKLKVLAPEYGGDGRRRGGRCEAMKDPLIGFPGHWGPNGVHIYSGTSFPAKYRGGAFIAFHGSWNRMPLAEAGYNVVFAPLVSGRPNGAWEVFADGFARDTLEPLLAKYRPMGFAQDRDGSLFLSDDQEGRIWRISYVGTRR